MRAISTCIGVFLFIAVVPSGLSAAAENSKETEQVPRTDAGRSFRSLIEADWIDHDRRFSTPSTLKGPQKSVQVTTAQDAAGGCDGIKTGAWGFHTASAEQDPWWQVDLGKVYPLDRVVVYNRTDRNSAPRARNVRVLVADDPRQEFRVVYCHNGETFYGVREKKPLVVNLKGKALSARIVRLDVVGRLSFALDEIEVYAAEDPQKNIARGRPADQKSVGAYSVAHGPAERATGLSPGPFSLAHTRDVLKRAREIAVRLRPTADPARLGPLAGELDGLDARLAAISASGSVAEDARRAIYLEARRVKRQIAFANPLLGFDKLLFIKRHDSAGVYHMCDQYYGCNARPGGGLFVLHDPWSDNPKVVDLLENATVEKGRLAGRKLAGGAFLSPEVSFDGKTILFAYSEAKAFEKSKGKECYLWGPEISHHIFRVNADGTGLVQLTDGDCDDFDPCFLPNGRIAFISERRGGYLRCGRHCPVYTLHSMRADGSDIIRLSYHETHEWQPSVANDGMLVYTRWDYVDRDTNIAHHIWNCFPDGRDPRSYHGNYPLRRETRPWMEMNIRAVPGSQKFVASTGAHHGHEFGSLVLIDPRVPDDGAAAQLTRLTPEVPFPESEGRPINRYSVYGTPWPLSEDDYLCVYDAEAKNRGVYWIDRFGNKELLYRDPEISCSTPIPLCARPCPPVIPSQTTHAAEDLAAAGGTAPPATVAVMNVYDSDFAWPTEAKVASLRVIQVLPKTTAPPNQPRIGIAEQTNARAVLGTVPVENDGSAYFEIPAGKEVYFQALDERGLAIQSMRSGTYAHPGERLSCQGCHETKHQPPPVRKGDRSNLPVRPEECSAQIGPVPFSSVPAVLPRALRRPPSSIRSDVDGSNPFNYVRLVQPVLDRNCVACHKEKKAVDLSGPIEGARGWTRSYTNLAARYGFYFHVTNGAINSGIHGGARTIPGKFGARASKLLDYLDQRHYGVRLSEEDYHRVTLWLDCNSEFFGSYENTQAQARGEMVRPSMD